MWKIPERDGINNMNNLPFANLPYGSINSIGKQWIRRFALSLSKINTSEFKTYENIINILDFLHIGLNNQTIFE